jgi:hypothetical protein
MYRLVPLAIFAATAAVASCAPAEPPATTAGTEPSAEVAGESCVSIAAIRESRVIDDNAIDFHMRDGRIYRNTLPHRCPSLGFEQAFTYSTSLTQLCSTDIIRVVQQGGGPQLGASCGLGKFVPYTPPAKDE